MIDGLAGANPAMWIAGLLFAGFGAVALAKVYGLLFMRSKTPHRLGDAMNVHRAEVTEWSGGEGRVVAGGESWRAVSNDSLSPGDKVVVAAMNGLVLRVKKK
ncbi:MAG: NfeD family protein [Pseudomonadota bacterium]